MRGRFSGAIASVVLAVAALGCGDDSQVGTSGAGGASGVVTTGAGGDPGSSGGGDGDSSSSVGSGAGGAASSGAGAGGGPPLDCADGPTFGRTLDCVECQAESCCINASGCNGDAACQAVEACTLENNLLSECSDQNPDAIWYVSGVVICRQNNCPDECEVPAAVCGNILPSEESCTEAIQDACCDETTACGENDACVAYIYQCIDANDCSTQACFDECLAQYPDAADDFAAMEACWATVECP